MVLEVATGHPRLWVRADELPKLRSWANKRNPIYAALTVAAGEAIGYYRGGQVPSQECAHKNQYCESYAMMFAFMSLLERDGKRQREWAEAARAILMHMVGRVNANASGDVLAAPRFSRHDRSRWAGEGFALTVDWIYPFLSKDDKQAIRKVFLRWAEELLVADTTGIDHPPKGGFNDPVLLADRKRRRYAANNYYTSHLRNLTLMAMAFDAADDPDQPEAGRTYPNLRAYLRNATGKWLFMTDSVLRNDARGGLAPEGIEYAARTLAFVSQTYLGLQTAGHQDVELHGPQVMLESNRFFNDSIIAFLHSISPKTEHHGWRDAFVPAWTGDGESFELVDFADYFAPLGIYARNRGDSATYEACRWIVTHTPPGGAKMLQRRVRSGYRNAVLYFLLLDPDAPTARDPRPALPLHHFSPGTGILLARTSWKEDATWFQYQLGWALIDHQHGDGNNFGFYRRGEWLLKERLGYGGFFERSQQHNTLTVENSKPKHARDERRGGFWKSGSQWVYSHDGDGKVLAHSAGKGFVFASGDATGMYNSSYEGVRDVKHVTRSILWLEPDQIVIYDRAVTGQARFKRFWLHTPALAKVTGPNSTMTSPGGQKLLITTLLPSPARIVASPYQRDEKQWDTKPADHEPMLADLSVEPTADSKEAEFLHVIQAGKAATTTTIRAKNIVGAVVGDTAVVFAVNPVKALDEVSFALAKPVRRYIVTGLTPATSYSINSAGGKVTVRKAKDGTKSDSGGVLLF